MVADLVVVREWDWLWRLWEWKWLWSWHRRGGGCRSKSGFDSGCRSGFGVDDCRWGLWEWGLAEQWVWLQFSGFGGPEAVCGGGCLLQF